MNKRVYVV